MVNKEVEKHLTPEELKVEKDKMLEFYTEGIPYLKAQLEYEDTLMKIDEVRLKRDQIQMQRAYMAMPQDEREELERQADLEAMAEQELEKGEKKQSKKPLRTK